MTPEEAREIIKQFRDRQGNSDEDVEALEMAIEALEQQPCEKTISSDSIPREKLETAKKMIKARFMDSGETVMQNETRRAVCREFIEILEEICG